MYLLRLWLFENTNVNKLFMCEKIITTSRHDRLLFGRLHSFVSTNFNYPIMKIMFLHKIRNYRIVDMARDMFVVVEKLAPLQVVDMQNSLWVIFGLMAFSIHFTVWLRVWQSKKVKDRSKLCQNFKVGSALVFEILDRLVKKTPYFVASYGTLR